MKCNAVRLEITVPLSEDGYVFDVGSLYEHFRRLADKRRARGKRYALPVMLVLLVLAKLPGKDCPYGIAEWARGDRASCARFRQ